jgi:hypothetical protein
MKFTLTKIAIHKIISKKECLCLSLICSTQACSSKKEFSMIQQSSPLSIILSYISSLELETVIILN